MVGLGAPELIILLVIFGLIGGAIASAIWTSRDATERSGSGGTGATAGLVVFVTFPLGLLIYVLLRQLLFGDRRDASPAGAGQMSQPASAATTPSSGPPPGWYDNPQGSGKRYWDGQAWTEHTQT